MGNKVQFIQSKLFNFVVFGKYCAIKLSQRNGGG